MAFLHLIDAGGVKFGCQGGRSNWVAEEAEACADSVPKRVGGWEPYESFIPEGLDVALPSNQIDPKEC